jgi:hypothetical protein
VNNVIPSDEGPLNALELAVDQEKANSRRHAYKQ